MQLTNFLRDVREDYEELGRIYMPTAILKQYGLAHSDIPMLIAGVHTDDIMIEIKQESRKIYMQYMITQCRDLYAYSLDGLQYLKPE
jgi:phytoene/squalene synthetase